MGTGIIIGMVSLTIVSSITEGIMGSIGKVVEASYVQLATKSLLICSVGVLVTKAIKVLATIG